MKKIYKLIVAAMMGILLVACSSHNTENKTKKDNWQHYQKTKTIKIGFDNTFVPMGYKDKTGKNVGFDIDLANAVFKQYDITVDWQPINWDLKEKELSNGNIDMIWNGYTITKERKRQVAFTDIYMRNKVVLVTKKSSNIKSLSDMKDKVVGAQSGSSSYDAFTSNPKVLKDIVKNNDATQYETFNQAFIDLKNNRIDGLLIDRVYSDYYLKAEGEVQNYNIVLSPFTDEDFAAGARKSDTTLVKKVDQAFKKLYKEGTFQKISNKWFGEDVATNVIK